MASQLRRKDRPRCGAKTRAGGSCMVRVEDGKARCRFHGGLSTGPKTESGRARIAEAQRRRWQAWREQRVGGQLGRRLRRGAPSPIAGVPGPKHGPDRRNTGRYGLGRSRIRVPG
jgi:hypothetical protein